MVDKNKIIILQIFNDIFLKYEHFVGKIQNIFVGEFNFLLINKNLFYFLWFLFKFNIFI